jgi:uncharacterized protein
MCAKKTEMKKPLVVYHASCVDGFTAAWCAWLLYGDDAEYRPMHYGEPIDLVDVVDRDVLIVDFSFPRHVLLAIQPVAKSLHVLDHHKTAQADLEGLDFCTFDMFRSGAGLAWDVLHEGKLRPPLIDYVEDRDLWIWKLSYSRVVSEYIALMKREFPAWTVLAHLIRDNFQGVVEKGEVALLVTEQYVGNLAQRAGTMVLDGHTVPIVNTTFAVSELVGKLAESALFAVGWFERQDGKCVYSLRSRGSGGADVSEIAKKYGGGGHRNAAGFTTDRPIHREA